MLPGLQRPLMPDHAPHLSSSLLQRSQVNRLAHKFYSLGARDSAGFPLAKINRHFLDQARVSFGIS